MVKTPPFHTGVVVQSFSHVWFFVIPWTVAQWASLSFIIFRSVSNSCPLTQWCHPTISSSVIPFYSCPQSFPASKSFQMSQFFASGSQNIGVSALASVLPMNIHDWLPLGWIGWISSQSKGLSRVFSNTIVQKHQLFGTQLSLWSSSHIHTWQLELLEVRTFMFYFQQVSTINTVLSAIVIMLYYTLNNQTIIL